MSQTQLMSFEMATELLQSVGIELVIFAITAAVAIAFHGAPPRFSSRQVVSEKVTKVPHARAKQVEQSESSGSECSVGPANGRAIKPSSACAQASSQPRGVARKVHKIMELASRRQAAEAIAIYDELRRTSEHKEIKGAMQRGKQGPADVFNALVQCAGRAGRTELIDMFLGDMTQAGIDRSLGFYESTMKMLASKICYKEALSVCSRLEADGLEPSPVTLSCLINFAVEVGESDRAIKFFERLASTSTPSIRAYMTILRVYSRNQNWGKSVALIRDMQARKAPIDSLVLNVVLATGIGAGHLAATKALLEEFTHMKMADVVSYNTVMKGFAQKKEVDGAIQLLDEMCQAGLRPNAITFNTAMDAAVRSMRIADAWSVLARMRDAGLAPDKFTCTTLMKGIQSGATSQQLIVILDLLRNVTKECDASLCGSLFRSVIEAAALVNDPKLTARAVAQMREQRVMLPAHEYQRLLQVLMRDDVTL